MRNLSCRVKHFNKSIVIAAFPPPPSTYTATESNSMTELVILLQEITANLQNKAQEQTCQSVSVGLNGDLVIFMALLSLVESPEYSS